MLENDKSSPRQMRKLLVERGFLLAFGLAVLTFLVAVDRTEWFAIRPSIGTSIAMAHASAAAQSDGSGAAKAQQ